MANKKTNTVNKNTVKKTTKETKVEAKINKIIDEVVVEKEKVEELEKEVERIVNIEDAVISDVIVDVNITEDFSNPTQKVEELIENKDAENIAEVVQEELLRLYEIQKQLENNIDELEEKIPEKPKSSFQQMFGYMWNGTSW
jgi:cell division septum initiation protein DivIVA